MVNRSGKCNNVTIVTSSPKLILVTFVIVSPKENHRHLKHHNILPRKLLFVPRNERGDTSLIMSLCPAIVVLVFTGP